MYVGTVFQVRMTYPLFRICAYIWTLPESLVFVLVIVILPAYMYLWTIKPIYKVFKALSKNRWGRLGKAWVLSTGRELNFQCTNSVLSAWSSQLCVGGGFLDKTISKVKLSTKRSTLIQFEHRHRLKASALFSASYVCLLKTVYQRLICIITVKWQTQSLFPSEECGTQSWFLHRFMRQ